MVSGTRDNHSPEATLLSVPCQVVMFADDTVIYFSANCCQNIEHHLNADLANLAEWFNNYLKYIEIEVCIVWR